MEKILKLKFDYENTDFCSTHYYVGEENDKKSNIVIIHEKYFERIMLATEIGEPFVDLKVGILVELNNKLYITVNNNGYTTLKEVKKEQKNMEQEIIQAIKEDKLYDYVANNFYKMSKEHLRDLILEIIYMIYFDYEYSIEGDRQLLNEHIVECLKENREWEE